MLPGRTSLVAVPHVTPRPASQDPIKLGESLGRKLGSVEVWTAGEAV